MSQYGVSYGDYSTKDLETNHGRHPDDGETRQSILDSCPPEYLPFVASLIPTILIILLLLSIIGTVFPIIGGVFALQRMKWGWALVGSIIAIVAMFPLGVASTIFVAMAKREFE